MRQRLFRFRRVAVAALTGFTVVGGMTVIGAGTAGAVTYASNATVGADSPPTVTSSGNQGASDLLAQFDNNFAANQVITFQVADNSGNNCSDAAHSIGFTNESVNIAPDGANAGDTAPTWSTALSATHAGCSGLGVDDTLTITLTNSAGNANGTDLWDVTVSSVTYNVGPSIAAGNVQVTADGAASTVAGNGSTSTPSSSSAVSNMRVEIFGGSVLVGAKDSFQQYVTAPGTDQPAADSLTSFSNTFAAGDSAYVNIVTNDGTNCNTATDTIGFTGTPTVTVTPAPGNHLADETAPTITVAYSSSGASCTTDSVKNRATFTITNSATGVNLDDRWNVDVSGIEYNVGAGAANGPIGVSAGGLGYSYSTSNESPLCSPDPGYRAPCYDSNAPFDSNAIVSNVTVGANSPPVAIDLPHSSNNKAMNQPISPITLTEAQAGALPGGTAPNNWLCIWAGGNTDTSTSNPTVTVTAGDAVAGTATVLDGYIEFPITTASTSASTFVISGINVDTSSNGFNDVAVYTGEDSQCSDPSGYAEIPETPPGFYAATTHPIFGATADDTAQAEFQYLNQFNSGCASSNSGYSAVLTRDDLPYDALAGAYLGGQLGTGTLLTPGGLNGTLSDSTLNALRVDGVQTVYVLGGPGAISYPIVAQLETTQAYACGGTQTLQQAGSLANPVYLQVVRIWGNTADDTASAIGQYFGSSSGTIGTAKFPGAYGMYNDTGGAESLPPINTGLRTAIVATDAGWQDATSAGPAAYDENWPVLLTPQSALGGAAAGALSNLGIEQVVVMGGQGAVSDTVVHQIQTLGIPVIRIAGHDFTDTSQLMAQFEQNNQSSLIGAQGLDWNDADVFVARGDYFGDSLAGAAVAGDQAKPILLSQDPTTPGPGMTAYFSRAGLEDGAYSIGYSPYVLRILGGPAAFSQVLINTLLNDISAGDNAG